MVEKSRKTFERKIDVTHPIFCRNKSDPKNDMIHHSKSEMIFHKCVRVYFSKIESWDSNHELRIWKLDFSPVD